MNSRDADNARFEELMAHEFPEGLIPADRSRRLPDPPSAEPAAEPDAPPPPVEADDVPADNGFRSWAPPDEPDEPELHAYIVAQLFEGRMPLCDVQAIE